ncbi:MAG: manganese efflux pump [Planctomycetes bacterium]|nr:manganese efflux pump [Planctomycetota bacterium]
MDAWWTLLLLALGLASDAVAVAIATAIRARHVPVGGGVEFGLWCGTFQGVMPALGYAGALAAGAWLAAVDHWIAFFVLGAIGVKLAIEGLRGDETQTQSPWPGLRIQMSLAFATSIDALVAGVTLPALGLGIWWPSLVIGGVTLVLVLIGAFLGRHLGVRIGRRAEVVGGVLLILIGTRILVSHLMAS